MDRLLQEFEQVIRHLEKDYVLLPIASAQQIAALLRAGAEMRERVHLEWQHPTLGYRPMYVDDEIAEHAKTWDAALEENKE